MYLIFENEWLSEIVVNMNEFHADCEDKLIHAFLLFSIVLFCFFRVVFGCNFNNSTLQPAVSSSRGAPVRLTTGSDGLIWWSHQLTVLLLTTSQANICLLRRRTGGRIGRVGRHMGEEEEECGGALKHCAKQSHGEDAEAQSEVFAWSQIEPSATCYWLSFIPVDGCSCGLI